MTPLHSLLNAYWLRPETALWRACDIRAMRGFKMVGPSLDLGCGDGVFSFIRAGGELAPEFDVFTVARLEAFFANVDVYDAPPRGPIEVAKRPDYAISVGIDHKANLLAKAATLGIYEHLQKWDANTRLPYADGHFSSVFSNILYWLDDPDFTLREIHRILKPRGTACFLLPNKRLGEYRLGIAELDRGRTDNIKHLRDDWSDALHKTGFKIEARVQYLSRPVIQLWDIGLRPFFPALKAMADAVPASEMAAVKTKWIETCEKFMAPMLANDSAGAFECFTVRRR